MYNVHLYMQVHVYTRVLITICLYGIYDAFY